MRAVLIGVLLALILATAAGAATLVTDKSLYKVGEKIIISFTDPEAHQGAWIGLFDAAVPTDAYTDADDYDQAYEYTGGKTSGYVEFTANSAGFFQIRFFNSDGDPDVPTASSATFEISTEGGKIGEPSVSFDKANYQRGTKVKLSFTWNPALPDGAWIGFFKNESPLDGSENPDNYDIKYEYVSGRTSGVWSFDAPTEPGIYRAAIISGDTNNWTPYCSVGMQVTLDGRAPLPRADERTTLALSAAKLRAGDELTVAYFIPYGLENSWIGIMPASCTSLNTRDNDDVDVSYLYAKSGSSWYWTFHVPPEPGNYVIRIFPSANDEERTFAIDGGVYFTVVPRT